MNLPNIMIFNIVMNQKTYSSLFKYLTDIQLKKKIKNKIKYLTDIP